MKNGQHEAALEVVRLVGTEDKAWLTVRYGAHVRLRQFDEALRALQRRIELNPMDVEGYTLMGMIHMQHSSSPALARDAFEAALTLHPNSTAAKSGLRLLESK